MPGGVPHWVLGTSNSICVGRHFYSASTIRSSVVTLLHTFLLGGSATNEEHQETRTLLYQMLVFWSMRIDVTDVDGGFTFEKLKTSANMVAIQGPIYRCCPQKRVFWMLFTWASLPFSPLLLTSGFIRAKKLHPIFWQRPPTLFATSIPSFMFFPSDLSFSLKESSSPIFTLLTGCSGSSQLRRWFFQRRWASFRGVKMMMKETVGSQAPRLLDLWKAFLGNPIQAYFLTIRGAWIKVTSISYGLVPSFKSSLNQKISIR